MTSGAPGSRRALAMDQSCSGGSVHTLTASRQPGHALEPLPSKRICFYKSGDAQFGGLRMVINQRTFKHFEALLDSLSTKVPLPFGVRNITTPRGVHAVRTLDQLEDGKSYICSDTRKVKPVNLALARKKLPPWYHARPGTGRRRAVQVARMFAGGGKRRPIGPVVVHTPRRLTVFRNGDPTVSQLVMLKKKSTQSFEVLMESLSELMQFPVVKLHSTDGRRVDGIPALILCSGMVVAAGKEAFKPGNYDIQRSPAPAKWPPAQRVGPRKIRQSKRKSTNYSESSQRYFLNQLHNSISESMWDYPSNRTDSVELESSHMLGSVVETDTDPCPDHGTHEQGSCLPTEDDIEKSFRVNQDGSMTVEMKVRLTLKEEETIHWTTTLTRSSVANELPLPDCSPEPELEAGSGLEQEQSHPAVPSETSRGYKPMRGGDDDDNNGPPPESGTPREEGEMDDDDGVTGKTSDLTTPRRAPTPGVRRVRVLTESMRPDTTGSVGEGILQSYSYRAETEQYCMVQQSSARPVPKPRRRASTDANFGCDQAEFNSSVVSEVLQIENNGGEVTETVLHVYEQQTCQENFYANTHYRAQDVSTCSAGNGRPSTSDTTWGMDAEVKPYFGRPSTASESIHTMRAACKSLVIKPPKKVYTTDKYSCQSSEESGKGYHCQNVDKDNKTSSNTKAVKKHVRWIKSPGNRRKQSPTEAYKKRIKVKPFSSTGFLKKIYGGQPVKTTMRRKKPSTEMEKARPATESLDVNMKFNMKDPNALSSGDDMKRETVPFGSNMLELSSKTRATLTNQKSIHEEKQTHKASNEVNRKMALAVSNSSSSVNNEYVEQWLDNSPSQHALCRSDQTQALKIIKGVGREGGISEGSGVNRLNNHSEDKTEKSYTKHASKNTSVPNSAMPHTVPSTISQTSAVRPLSVSPATDQAPSPTDHPKTTSIPSLSAGCEEPLSRNSSVKRAQLVSNLSFKRKMSQGKASVENSTIQAADGETLELNSFTSMKEKEPTAIPLERSPHTVCISDQTSLAGKSSYCASEAPVSTSPAKKVSLSSLASSDTSYVAKPPAIENVSTKTLYHSSTQTETIVSKPLTTKSKDIDLPLERKLSNRKARFEDSTTSNELPGGEIPVSISPSLKRTQLPRKQSLNLASSHKPSVDLSKVKTLNGSPTSESPSSLHKTYSQKTTSPYSQSLDLVSSPVQQRTKKNLVQKNLSPGKKSEQTNPTPEEPEIPQRSRQPNDLEVGQEVDLINTIETGISTTILSTGLNERERDTQSPQLTNQTKLQLVLEKICFSIKSIRQITENKRQSCLEKSNSPSDFLGHVVTTFGSSSKALLAFLAVMTLKEVQTQEKKGEMAVLNSSCAESLKLIDSLREIASIEDSDQLKISLSELHKSSSSQLLQSWKGFQELSKSRRSPNQCEEGLRTVRCSVEYSGTEEGAIDELMEELHLPEKLKEELDAFPFCIRTARVDSGMVEANATEKPSYDTVTTNSGEETVNARDQTRRAIVGVGALVDVKAIAKRFTDTGKPQASHVKPANLKHPNLSDDQKAVNTQQKTHNTEDATTDCKDTALLQEDRHPISVPHVPIEDNKEVDSRNHGEKVEEEGEEQGSLNENQTIKSDVPYMDLEKNTEEKHEENRCKTTDSKELDGSSDDSMFSPEEVSSSDEEQRHILGTEGRYRNICHPKTKPKQSSPEEQQDVELRQLKQVRNNNMSDYKSLSSSEEEEHKLQCCNRFKRLAVTSGQDVEDRTSSEDEQHLNVQQSRTITRSVHIFPCVDKQILQKLTKIESLSEKSEKNVSTTDSEERLNLEKDQPHVHKHDHQQQLGYTEAMTIPEGKAVNQKQHDYGKQSPEATPRQRPSPQQKAEPSQIISRSVAERIDLLNKQMADTQCKSKTARGGAGTPILADEGPLNVETCTPDPKKTRALPGSRSAPQTSLSFSYDSGGIINRQPEGATVRSIKEVFMAKSVQDVLREGGDVTGPIRSGPNPASRSQVPEELSEAAAIAKGFVRRTIERLYGRKDPTSDHTPGKRATPSPKQTKESSSIFSSLHSARATQQSDKPYFNSTNTLNTMSGAACRIAFNTQVGPRDGLQIDHERTLNRKSVSDLVEINKATETPTLDTDPSEDFKRKVPVSLFSTNPEPEDTMALSKCTYFSLPCASDSELAPEDPGAAGKNVESSSVDAKEDQEEAKGCAGNNGTLPCLSLHGNKVHPLTPSAPGGPVVVQPARGQRVVQRPVELDALDALYTFCGQHCPIL